VGSHLDSPATASFLNYRPEQTSYHQRANCSDMFGTPMVEALNLSAGAADRSGGGDVRRSHRNAPYGDMNYGGGSTRQGASLANQEPERYFNSVFESQNAGGATTRALQQSQRLTHPSASFFQSAQRLPTSASFDYWSNV
jgi:hypothetical protein